MERRLSANARLLARFVSILASTHAQGIASARAIDDRRTSDGMVSFGSPVMLMVVLTDAGIDTPTCAASALALYIYTQYIFNEKLLFSTENNDEKKTHKLCRIRFTSSPQCMHTASTPAKMSP